MPMDITGTFPEPANIPIYSLGCIQDVKLTEDVTLNMIRCDTVGD